MSSWSRLGLPVMSMALLPALTACASSGPEELSPGDEPTVELVVHNERTSAVAAYVQWQGLRPIRLGVIAAGSSATYLPAFRSQGLCLLTTSLGNTSFSTAVPERAPANRCLDGVPVDRGQRMDVILRANGWTCYLQRDPDC